MRTVSFAKHFARVAALALVAASPAFAQQPAPASSNIARLENVEGNVLVGGASGLVSGGKGLALQEGTRVLTTARGKALVKFDDGCEVRLEPNQRYVVSREQACEMRILMVQGVAPAPLPPAPNLAGAALAGNVEPALAFGAVTTGVALWNRRDGSVSPN